MNRIKIPDVRSGGMSGSSLGVPIAGRMADPGGLAPSPVEDGGAQNPSTNTLQRVALVPAEMSLGGTASCGGSNTQDVQPTTLQVWKAPDGVPRRHTVMVMPGALTVGSGAATAQQNGLLVRITVGSAKGSVARWYGAPCIVETEGTYVKVEGLCSATPFRLNRQAPTELLTGVPPRMTTAAGSIVGTAVILEGGQGDPGAPIMLAASQAPVQWNIAGQVFLGPAILHQVVFSNTNATAAVLMAIYDMPTGIAPAQGMQVGVPVYVPPASTLAVGKDLLGAFGSGLQVQGISASGNPDTHDPNDANVLVSAFGQILLPGS